MTLYNLFRDTATRRAKTGEAEIPGLPSLGAEHTLYVRAMGETLVEIGGDTVQRRVWWLLPDAEIAPGDTLDGFTVAEVAEATDLAGNRLYWIAYAEG